MLRKWETRKTQVNVFGATAGPATGAQRMIDQARRELRNIGREMVLSHLNRKDDTDTIVWSHDFPSASNRVTYRTEPRFTLMVRDEEPGRIYFRRDESDPWTDLGFLSDNRTEFRDVSPTANPFDAYRRRDNHIHYATSTPAPLVSDDYGRRVKEASERHAQGVAWDKLKLTIEAPTTPEAMDIYIGKLPSEENNPMMEDPEALEASATRAMARAEEIRRYLNREPKETETTISWEWLPEHDQPGGHGTNVNHEPYVFVAFRDRTGVWRVTSDYPHAIRSDSWSALGGRVYAEPLRAKEPKFLIAEKWRDAK